MEHNSIDNLIHSDLDALKSLKNYTFESKMQICCFYSSNIIDISVPTISLEDAYIMPWELEIFASFSIFYNEESTRKNIDDKTFKKNNYLHSKLCDSLFLFRQERYLHR